MCCAAHVEKARPRKPAVRHNRKLEARSKGLSGALSIWLMRYGEAEMRRVRSKLKAGGYSALRREYVRKRLTGAELAGFEDDLQMLLVRYGLRQAADAGKTAAAQAGARWTITPALTEEILRVKQNKVKLLVSQTNQQVRSSIQRLLADAMAESPRPTVHELGRRIARTWFGPAMGSPAGQPGVGLRGTVREEALTANWARNAKDLTADSEHLFSFTRAHTIARTEVAQARGQGQAQAYTDVGVDKVEWVAYPNDGRSGERRHHEMNDHRPITTADMMGSDQSKWFRLPSGIMTPYPNWIGLPAGETINCRCNLIAIS